VIKNGHGQLPESVWRKISTIIILVWKITVLAWFIYSSSFVLDPIRNALANFSLCGWQILSFGLKLVISLQRAVVA